MNDSSGFDIGINPETSRFSRRARKNISLGAIILIAFVGVLTALLIVFHSLGILASGNASAESNDPYLNDPTLINADLLSSADCLDIFPNADYLRYGYISAPTGCGIHHNAEVISVGTSYDSEGLKKTRESISEECRFSARIYLGERYEMAFPPNGNRLIEGLTIQYIDNIGTDTKKYICYFSLPQGIDPPNIVRGLVRAVFYTGSYGTSAETESEISDALIGDKAFLYAPKTEDFLFFLYLIKDFTERTNQDLGDDSLEVMISHVADICTRLELGESTSDVIATEHNQDYWLGITFGVPVFCPKHEAKMLRHLFSDPAKNGYVIDSSTNSIISPITQEIVSGAENWVYRESSDTYLVKGNRRVLVMADIYYAYHTK